MPVHKVKGPQTQHARERYTWGDLNSHSMQENSIFLLQGKCSCAQSTDQRCYRKVTDSQLQIIEVLLNLYSCFPKLNNIFFGRPKPVNAFRRYRNGGWGLAAP